MIRFKCIYCGQKMLAQDDGVGKKGKCPKCSHLVVVPRTTKGRPAISDDTPEQLQQIKESIAAATLDPTKYSPDEIVNLYGERPGWLIPTYDELSLFLMAIILILLYIVNATMRVQIHNWISEYSNAWVYIIGAIFLCGLYLSVYHIFTTREKKTEKWGMLIFAVLANAITGIVAGLYVLKNDNVRNWQLVFPIWNIINGALLLLMLRFKIIDEECISDRDANTTEVVISMAAALIIFAICNYVFKLYWAITFSICIIYATSFDKALQSVFPGLTYREDDQAP